MQTKQMNNCPICGSTEYRTLSFGGYDYDDREMPLVQCQKCFLNFIIHGLTPEEFVAFYNDKKYFDSEYAGGIDISYADSRNITSKKANLIMPLIKRYKPTGHLLEIGCAGGYFLEEARDRFGYDVYGVEISKGMSEECRARGLNVFCGTPEQMPEDGNMFDIVYMGDVLEHISKPIQFMESIKSRMQSDAIMVLELPMTYNLTVSGIIIGLLNMLKGNFGYRYFLPAQHRHVFEEKPPYHVLMFSRRSIKYFFEKEGFVVRYLKIYEDSPKAKFDNTWYSRLKVLGHWLTLYLPQNWLGDRMIVIAQKT